MFLTFFTLFVVGPILEILVLIQVGKAIGGINTVLLLLVTALIGATMVRSQGMRSWQKAQLKMASGELPGREIADGVMIFIAGLMFVTPGFITDIFAIALLLPPVRQVIGQALMARMQVKMMHGGMHGSMHMGGFSQRPDPFRDRDSGEPRTFEGEYERKDKEKGNQENNQDKDRLE